MKELREIFKFICSIRNYNGDLNKIVNQNTFDIAYYLLDESIANDSDEDRIVLEDGHGSVLLESSKRTWYDL